MGDLRDDALRRFCLDRVDDGDDGDGNNRASARLAVRRNRRDERLNAVRRRLRRAGE